MKITSYNENNPPTEQEKNKIGEFLFKELEEYGDPLEDIQKAMDYALGVNQKPGGSITAVYDSDELVGAVVTNKTGMDGYIPENILVYIATDRNRRGKGIGKSAMKHVIDYVEGNIALHVEPQNPAKFLYEKLGFTNKYLEMRLNK